MPVINTGEELLDFFWYCGLQTGTHSVNVSTKVRKDVMTGDKQNKAVVNCGRVVQIGWKNLGGGIWQASVTVE